MSDALPTLWCDDTARWVDKRAGLLVHNSGFAGPRERTATEIVRDTYDPSLVPAHRLDRGTSGALVFAARDHAAAWQSAMTRDDADKRYLALVRGHLRDAVDVDHPLADEDGTLRDARSRVEPLCHAAQARCCLVCVRVFTGRTHQVRRHLKHLSHPVLGDANYGKGPLNREFRARYGLARLALHAWHLEVTHPIHGARVGVYVAIPDDLAAPWRALFGDAALREALGASWPG